MFTPGVPDNPNVQPLPWPVTNDCPKGSSSCRFGCVCQSLELRKEYFSHSCRSPGCMLELECMRPEDPSHSFYPRVSIMNGFESRNGKKHHLSESTDHLTIQEPIAGRNRLLRKRKKDACGSSSSTTLERSSGLGISDPKLKQRCFVRLVRLDMNTIKKGSLIAYPNKTRRRTIKPAPCYRELPRRRCRSAGMGTKANGVEKKSMVSYQDWKLTAKTSVCLTRLRSKPGGTAYFCMDHQKRGCACLKL